MTRRLWPLAVAAPLLGLLACSDLELGFPNMSGEIDKDITIAIPSNAKDLGPNAFGANPTTLREDATVTWVNHDTEEHDLRAADGSWASGPISSGGRFQQNFGEPGDFDYSCVLHGESGSFTVEDTWAPQPLPSGGPGPVASSVPVPDPVASPVVTGP